MPVERARVIPLFKESHLFAGMDEAQLSQAARYFTEKRYQPDELIIRQGSAPDYFYFIQDGDVVISRKANNVEVQQDLLSPGDYFGEEALLLKRPRTASARAFGSVTLLLSDQTQFHRLLIEFPQIKANLEHIIQSRQFIRKHPFTWLNDDEVAYQVRRKHIAYLFITLIAPVVVFLIGLVMLLFGLISLGYTTTMALAWAIFSGLVVSGGLLWMLWNVIDWSNDFYIVTNQRVVWIEKVIGLYESREEAPLDAIRGINVSTRLVGRILGFGDVIVSTYTGEVPLRHVDDPYQMDAVIREFWRRVQRITVQARQLETENEVDKILGREPAPETVLPPATQPAAAGQSRLKRERAPGEIRELSFSERYFGNLFRLRFEDGDTITYRKHWLVLLGKTWLPMLLAFLGLGGLMAGVWLYYQGDISGTTMTAIVVLVVLFLIPTLIWWLYNYINWSNDIYQVTKDSIYDIERKPLGTETRTSAPLDRVISIGHERTGFIGYIFNVGNVVVNVGEANLTFNGVYQPAQVQQDVFQRMRELQNQKQRAEIARERDRILSLLEVYHRKVNGEGPENE